MFMTRKINKDTVAVVYDSPVSIWLRKSGKKYYGTEEEMCEVIDGKVVINADVAVKYGLEIDINKADT